MKTRATLAALCGLALCLTGRADDKETVKEIDLKGVKLKQVEVGLKSHTEIKSAEDLAKVVTDKDAAEMIAKKVDFEKQKLVYLAWSGSGQDKVVGGEGGKKGSVVLRFTPGRTRDFRPHFKMFAVPKDATITIGR